MKVGTDGVLLGAWAGGTEGHQKALDIGSGTGLIGLMLCQRFECAVMAIEIEASCFEQGKSNFANSPWPQKFTALHGDATQIILPSEFDLIVSNPPFFDGSYLPNQNQRAMARHQGTGLRLEELFAVAAQALAPVAHARFALILPATSGAAAQEQATLRGLHLLRRCEVRGHAQAPIKRLLLEWGWNAAPTDCGELILEKERGVRTDAYQNLTGAFYLPPLYRRD